MFSRFGRINFSALTNNENGAGIVLFENKDDAHKAVQALQGRAIDESGVQITLNLYNIIIIDHQSMLIYLKSSERLSKKNSRQDMKDVTS